MNEDFELAIVYKRKITEFEKHLMSEDDFNRVWNDRPILTQEELLCKLVDLDYEFAKTNIDELLLSSHENKIKTACLYISLKSQKQQATSKIKSSCEEVVQALYTRLNEVKEVRKQLAAKAKDLTASEAE